MRHPEHKTRSVMRSFAERIAEQNRGAQRRWDLLWIALGLPNGMLHFGEEATRSFAHFVAQDDPKR